MINMLNLKFIIYYFQKKKKYLYIKYKNDI